jgi:RNA polymerase sigma factor (sigma-70 family)
VGDETDAEVWARVRTSDEAALAVLFDLHRQRLFRHASRMLSNREDAKDAVVVAFYEAWRKRASVRLVDGSPLPWLLATVGNVSLNLERSARRYRALLGRVPASAPAPAASAADESGTVAAVRALPAGQRDLLVLTAIEGYPLKDAATALGISLGTAKSRLSRAKARLRDQLTDLEV